MSNICSNIEEGLENSLEYKYLFVNNKGLKELPSCIAAYKNCIKILASENKLSKIPDEIGVLDKLEMLHLDSNKLSTLPESLVNCTRLNFLYLHNNRFTHLPEWIGKFTELKNLFVRKNNLCFLPKSLGNLIKLDRFDCSYNHISTLPQNMENCRNLKIVKLESNNFTEFPEQIKGLKQIEWLNISKNPISKLPDWLPELTNLTHLTLSYCNISVFPEVVLKCPNLEELRIESNCFKNIPISDNLFSLRLYIKGNPLRFRNRLEFMGRKNMFRHLSYNLLTDKKKLQYAQKAAWYFRGIRYKLNKEFHAAGIIDKDQRIFSGSFFNSIEKSRFSEMKYKEIQQIIKAYYIQIENLKILGYEAIEEIEKLECPRGLLDTLY